MYGKGHGTGERKGRKTGGDVAAAMAAWKNKVVSAPVVDLGGRVQVIDDTITPLIGSMTYGRCRSEYSPHWNMLR